MALAWAASRTGTEGVDARVSATADARRIGQFADEAFREVYGLGEDYRAWVVAV